MALAVVHRRRASRAAARCFQPVPSPAPPPGGPGGQGRRCIWSYETQRRAGVPRPRAARQDRRGPDQAAHQPAGPVEIKENPEDAYAYTAKGNLVAVVTNGTAVLGLGNIGALAGKPVMEGKGNLFKQFADLDCFDLEVGWENPDDVI
jgi:hypothetical protein